MTLSTQLVLRAMLPEPAQEMSGAEISTAAGLPSGTIHPVLARLEKAGWLTSDWEDVDPAGVGRPRRRRYRINPDSVAAIRSALVRAQPSDSRALRLRPGLAGGAR